MKNKYWIIIFIILIFIGLGIFLFLTNSNQKKMQTAQYKANRTVSSINSTNNNTEYNSQSANDTEDSNVYQENKSAPVETEIATFTTPIISKDPSRQKNIAISCSTLNDTLVENGATFSFCNTVGQATTAKGYEKAEIFNSKR